MVLVDGTTIVFHTDESSRLVALVGGAVTTAVKTSTLSEFGLSDTEVAAIVEPVPLDVVTLEAAEPQEDAKSVAAFVGTLVLYVSILMFGQFVAMGTVEEKQNRVVEVILARVRPWQILVGKVVGIGLLGLLQLALLGGAAYVAAQLANLGDIDLAEIGLPIIAGVFFWFVLGYTFYAFLYAAVGSTVSRQEDLQGSDDAADHPHPSRLLHRLDRRREPGRLAADLRLDVPAVGAVRHAGTDRRGRGPAMGDRDRGRRHGPGRRRPRLDRIAGLRGSRAANRWKGEVSRSVALRRRLSHD